MWNDPHWPYFVLTCDSFQPNLTDVYCKSTRSETPLKTPIMNIGNAKIILRSLNRSRIRSCCQEPKIFRTICIVCCTGTLDGTESESLLALSEGLFSSQDAGIIIKTAKHDRSATNPIAIGIQIDISDVTEANGGPINSVEMNAAYA